MWLIVDIPKNTGNGGGGNVLISNIHKINYFGEFKGKKCAYRYSICHKQMFESKICGYHHQCFHIHHPHRPRSQEYKAFN